PSAGCVTSGLPKERIALVQHVHSAVRGRIRFSKRQRSAAARGLLAELPYCTGDLRRCDVFGERRAACHFQCKDPGVCALYDSSAPDRHVSSGIPVTRPREVDVQLWRSGESGEGFRAAPDDGFFRFRFSGQFALANGRAPRRLGLDTGVELQESDLGIQDRARNARKTSAGAANGPDQLFCACLAALFLLHPIRITDGSADRLAPDELFLSGVRVFLISSADGVSRGPSLGE